MSELTRRRFVSNSASAVAGMTVVGGLLAERASAEARKATRKPIVVWIRDPHKGEIELMTGDREIRVKDHKLVAQIARVARDAERGKRRA